MYMLCHRKDTIIFATKEDHEAPSNAELVEEDPNDPYEERGLILPSGEINWNCPCLGGMASGPCGSEFKEAFSCFHYSKEEECMQRYPELYPRRTTRTSKRRQTKVGQAPHLKERRTMRQQKQTIYDVIVRLAPVEHGTESAAA
uniref:Coiled-coil-helix-coiled-coil-helix domain containing 4b n=1 Tax=Neogobius melanostomus TaxID=47308 RepID=A0A8C6U1M7_9GOBI